MLTLGLPANMRANEATRALLWTAETSASKKSCRGSWLSVGMFKCSGTAVHAVKTQLN